MADNGVIRITAYEGEDSYTINVGSASDVKIVFELPHSLAHKVIDNLCSNILYANFDNWISEPMGLKEDYEKPEGDNVVSIDKDNDNEK